MSNTNDSSGADPIEFDPFEERALDAMLSEVIGKSQPPDLSDQILSKLRETPVVRSATSSSSSRTNNKRSAARVWFIIAAIAASVIGIALLRPERQLPVLDRPVGDSLVNSGADKPKPETPDAPVQSPVTPKNQIAVSPPKPIRSIPLVLDNMRDGVDSPLAPTPEPASTVTMREPTAAIKLVSHRVDTQLRQYWNAIGIKPTEATSPTETSQRLQRMFGVEFSLDDLADVETIRAKLTESSVAKVVAMSWLSDITQHGIERLEPSERDALVDATAESFAGRAAFDSRLAGWIGGRDPASSAFYSAMSIDAKSADDGVLARRLASLSMNVDLRCTRCHDAYIEGSGRQEDYWSFASMLRGPSDEPTFFDLPDGRKRVARSGVPGRWMKTVDDAKSLSQWADQLAGSRPLALGIVNSLWQSIHGQPLRSRVVDLLSAPHNDSLAELENELVDDLQRSDFDLGRTLALMVASPATNRAVPESLEKAWVIDNAKDRAAAEAFAAARPPATELTLVRRLDESMRAIGGKLDAAGNPLLAQIGDASGDTRKIQSDGLSWDFPDRAENLPVQWLLPIAGTDARVDHLVYLAGKSETPSEIRMVSNAMQDAGVDEATLLNRVWWLVK